MSRPLFVSQYCTRCLVPLLPHHPPTVMFRSASFAFNSWHTFEIALLVIPITCQLHILLSCTDLLVKSSLIWLVLYWQLYYYILHGEVGWQSVSLFHAISYLKRSVLIGVFYTWQIGSSIVAVVNLTHTWNSKKKNRAFHLSKIKTFSLQPNDHLFISPMRLYVRGFLSKLYVRWFGLTPNTQPGRRGYPFSAGSSLFFRRAWKIQSRQSPHDPPATPRPPRR